MRSLCIFLLTSLLLTTLFLQVLTPVQDLLLSVDTNSRELLQFPHMVGTDTAIMADQVLRVLEHC